jgi:tyrocidine synthetase-3
MNSLLKDIADNNVLLEVVAGELKVFASGAQVNADLITRIKENRKELIQFLLKNEQKGFLDSFAVRIPPVPVQDSYSLSPAQRRLWVLSQFESGNIAYNIPGAFVFEEHLDTEALDRSFNLLINRHEILRTVFREDEQGEVRQWVQASCNFSITFTDLRNNTVQIHELLNRDFSHVFDLATGPLLKATVYRLTDNKWILSFVMHHTISDGWSMGVLIRELLQFYNGSDALTPLRIQYKDYAHWQARQLSGEKLEAHRIYWLNRFSGELPVLELLSDNTRPLVKSFTGGKKSRLFRRELSEGLKRLVKEHDATMYMGLLAAVNTLLYRYTAQTDLIIGTPVAGREHIDLEEQIGLYMNILALRCQFRGSDSYEKLLSSVREHTLNAYAHQVYPFDALVDELHLQRDLSRHPLFDVMVVLHNYADNTTIWNSGTGKTRMEAYTGELALSSKFDLQFDFAETGDTIGVDLTYNADIFNESRINRLMLHLENLLTSIVSSPETALDQLRYLAPEEVQELTGSFNDTGAAYPSQKTVTALFEEQVLLRPEKIALVSGNTRLTYRELNSLSNRVARHLHEQFNVGADDLVGVQLERSEWQIICLLGVLKAGGAYVPIDPTYPQERIEYILSDSNCKAVLDAAALEQLKNILSTYNDSDLPPVAGSRNLMYVIYTSGSTGRPKGCMLEHRGVVSRLNWMWRYYSFTPDDIILQKTSFTFDVSVSELFLPLCFGASEVLCPPEDVASPEKILSLISSEGVTCLHFVPSMLNSFLGYGFDADVLRYGMRSVTNVMTIGEALTAGTVERWYEQLNIPLHNLYGPTEASIQASAYTTHRGDKVIPIGGPIWNTQLYILDPRGQLSPVGVQGEICIGGDGLARGYLNKPELTAEKFVANPFKKTEQIYRTGDTGYWTSDGMIIFTGRKDDQVKVRGYRIEIGEIEHVLQQHSDINDAVVVARTGSDGEKELIAYLVSNIELNTFDIEAHLRKSLPVYMLPSYYVQLDALPLNSSGKADRKSLPVPEGMKLGAAAGYVAPRNAREQQLVQVWSEVLGIDAARIGLYSNFFNLGGHSLRAIRLTSRIYKVFSVKVALKDIFSHPVLEEQALLLSTLAQTAYLQIPKAPEQDSYALSSAQQRLWVLSQFEEGNIAYNIPAAYEFTGTLDVAAFRQAFNTLISRHEILRTVFAENEQGEVRQFIQATVDFNIDCTDLRNGGDVTGYLKKDFARAFDLGKGPLLRVAVFQLSDSKWIVGFVMHHIISDGVSMIILIDELLQLYSRENNLPPLRIQYRDYAHWQHQQLSGDTLAVHRAYWLQQFAGELPVLELPGTKTRPATKTYVGQSITRQLNAELTAGLKQLVKDRNATLFMGLLAAVNTLLYRYTGQEDIIIGSQIAGREHVELEGQLGNFLNTLALRNRFKGDDSFIDLLSAAANRTLDAYAHQVYPFDRLVDELDLQRDLSRHPLFDVSVVLQNMGTVKPFSKQLTRSLHIHPYTTVRDAVSKFDLAFNFIEVEDHLLVDLVYNTDIYTDNTAIQLLQHFEQLLASIIAAPAASLNHLSYISVSEKQRLLGTFNDTAVVYPASKTIPQVFNEQSVNTPHKAAVLFEDKIYTYKELDERSSQLGHYLQQEYGVGRNDLVGVMVDRSEKLLLAILGILKAGAAYVPIDPAYPQARKQFILNDTGAKVLITQSDHLFELDYYTGGLFAIDIQLDNLSTPVSMPPVDSHATDLAYVMYTSGSTGQPKGTLVEQRSVLRLVLPCNFVPLTGNETLLSTGAISFDATTFEYWSMLLTGGSLVMCSRETLLDSSLLAAAIRTKQVDTMWFTAGWLNELVDGNIELFATLKTVIAGGDKLSPVHINRLKEVYPSLRIINGYGPTENTTFSLTHEIGSEQTVIPIGRPINNSSAYILDKNGALCGIGVAGEICVGGDGLARGYLNQPALTAEKFVPNPVKAGERMYRTGDTGYWTNEGVLIFTGRKDDQVKVRGYRVELGEIEHVLQQHSDITNAVVVPRNGSDAEKELVAYIVGTTQLNTALLTEHLAKTLPAYMLPVHYVQLDALPLTANGKVDRKLLPAPGFLSSGSNDTYQAPRSSIEIQLADVWSNVLGTDQAKIGLHSNFFDLGGHSLKAVRLSSQLHKVFGVKVALKDIFSHPVLEEQALLLSTLAQTAYLQIPKAPEQDSYALSSAQQRLWVLSQFEEGNIAYNIPAAYEFTGTLDVAAFRQAFNTLISRHEILRTVFAENEQGEVRQFIQATVDFNIDCTDLRNGGDVTGYLKKDFARAFDLGKGPLLRVAVFQLSDSKWIVGFVMHHIISDGVSMIILIDELLQLYSRENNLPPLRIQYRDYAHWQHQQLSGDTLAVHRAYWLQQFAGELPVLELPGTKTRPATKTYVGQSITRQLNAELTAGLKQLVKDRNATLFMGLLAAVNTLLYRYTGQEDIIIGSQIAGREHVELEGQLGNFLNTLALRNRFKGDDSFIDLLSAAANRTLDAYAHQVYPFDRLVDELDLQRDLSRHPLFDVSVVLQNMGTVKPFSKQLTRSLHIHPYTTVRDAVSKFDLAFNFIEVEDHLLVDLVYNTDIYTDNTAIQLLQHFEQLLASIIAAPAASLNHLSYISVSEKQRLLGTFNDTAVVYPASKTIPQVFNEQSVNTPHKAAVLFEDKIYTYKELDERSSQLGHYLQQEYGVGRNDLVGVMVDRSEKLLLAILGILKAGAAYVPIDPAYPQARKQFILNDTGAKVLITQSDHLFELDYYTGGLFAIDIQLDNLSTPVSMPPVDSHATDLAYVMYTSGSTGQPKGTLVEQRSVLRLVLPCNFVPLTGNETLLSTGAISFDATTFEYWSMLLTGGSLVMCSRETLLDSSLLAAAIRTKQVDTMWFTAGWLNELVDGNIELFATLKTVIAGGDKLSPVHINRLKEVYPSLRIINGYGPTENTTFSLTHEIGSEQTVIPIGRPINNSSAYILDKNGALCGIGVAGEICVGGDGLARGYLNQPALTAEKFVPNPVKAGERMYRTGDTGYWTNEGVLIFTGRKDDQVKVRGYRVELGEIEHVLQQHSDITNAVVVPRNGSDAEKELVAYIVGTTQLNTALLTEHLAKTLPAYMLPVHYVQLDALPLNANGKIDRKSLPSPWENGAQEKTAYLAPGNDIERKLTHIWGEVLGVDRETISINENFFSLGGHSLKAIRLATQLHREFEVKIALKDIFANPVLAEQALLIAASGKTTFATIPQAPAQESYVLSSSQRRLWVLSQFEDGNVAYNVPGAYVFEGALNSMDLEKSITKLIARHEILRTVFREDEKDEVRQFIKPPEPFVLFCLDLREDQQKLNALLEQDALHVFDLTNGPLLKAALYQLADNKWIFSYVMHHIISDGVSMEVIMKELMQLYKGENDLSPLRIQYKDYATWQQQQLNGEKMAAHRSYWTDRFSGELPVLELLTDRPRPAVKTYSGGQVNKQLGHDLYKGLKQLTHDQNATLFMGLLAAVNTLLYRYTGQEDIIIGSPVAGREHVDLEGQIGFYVNTLALRSRFKGGLSFIELLSDVRSQTLDAYTHQAYPFDQLVGELNLQHDRSRYPLFDVALALLQENADVHNERFTDLQSAAYHAGTGVNSKFDLQFTFAEFGDNLHVTIIYNSDIYPAYTAQLMLGHLEQLLTAIIDDPSTALNQLNYLSAGERHRLTETFNNTAVDYPREKTIVDIFEWQAERSAGKAAVVFDNTTLSYSKLNEEASRLAHFLKNNYAIGVNDRVGIKLHRSEKLMIVILGILKAGAAFVPVLPEYPQHRIDYIVADSGCKMLIDEQVLTTFEKEKHNYSSANIPVVTTASSLAYIMYTSGSTGQPKGVMVEHRSVLRLVIPCNFVPLTGNETLLSTGAISFDATTFEYWSMLLTGGKLVFCSNDKLLDASLLTAEIKEKKVDTMWFTAGWLNELVDRNMELFAGLKTVIAGGDKLSPVHINRLKAAHPSLRIVNGYGPTENTTFSLIHEIGDDAGEVIPIGRPINNSTAYILDENGLLCGLGVAGEICLGGDGLARGYLNHAALTAEKFVASPVKEGERIYKSGDMGRWLPDGTMVFIGRKDNQVKIRGFRVETGEIEHTLQQYPGVSAAVVTVHNGAGGEKELVAYIVSNDELNVSLLAGYLEKTLPAYMIPAHFVQLRALPLNNNGKVDKKALPAPETHAMDTGNEYIAPRNAAEQQLVYIWSELLDKEKISVKDNFFLLGGNSIKATRLVTRLFKTFNVKLGLKEVFSHPVLEELALLLGASGKTVFADIMPAPVQPRYTLSSSQRRLWVMSRFEAASIAYNVPGAYVFEGALNIKTLEAAFAALIERHEILRTIFKEDKAGDVWQEIQAPAPFMISYTDLRDHKERVHDYVQGDFAHPFNLAEGPLLRAALYRLADNNWVFTYVMHHIISDGLSMNVLIKELLELYNGDNNLAPLRIQYKDYACWQQQQLTGEGFQAHRSYWMEQFAGQLPVLNLVGDRPRPAIKTYAGGRVTRRLNAHLCSEFKGLLQKQQATLFMGLLATVNTLLYRYTGQEDIIVGSSVSCRDHIELENQIGFYINALALRSRFKGEESFESLLALIHTLTLNAYSHQSYPFDELVEQLKLPRDIARNPLFDVVLVLQESESKRKFHTLGDLAVTDYAEGKSLTCRFDLTFDFKIIGDEIEAALIYNSDIFYGSTAERMLNHLEQLLTTIIQSPLVPLNRLDYITAAEKKHLLVELNDNNVPYPAHKTIAQLFTEQAAKTPANPALVYGDVKLTYKELNEQSNQLAHYLLNKYRINRGHLVAIALERSEKMIIAMLAILKAGAAYIPIDTEFPKDRIDYMISDSKCKALIDAEEFDRFSQWRSDFPVTEIETACGPEDLAYVVYTSGSTGKPKGVMISHRALVDYSYGIRSRTNIEDCGSFGLVSTIAADLGNTIIYTSLLIGGALHIFSAADVMSPENMMRADIDCLKIVPSHFAALQSKGKLFAPRKCLIFGGERLTPDILEIIRSGGGQCQVFNHYGPSETTIGKLVKHLDLSSSDVISLGRPFGNNYVYILDNHLQLVPQGVVGEICIGGHGLGKGYMNQPELTTQKFVPDPFKPTAFIYRTGDLGCLLTDGNIAFLGRKDDQIKIRGFRIEPGEIEQVLLRYTGIEQAVVMPAGNEGLVAYFTGTTEITINTLRAWLFRKLPAYMIPSWIIQLDKIPITLNGKIDRSLLPALSENNKSAGYIAARNDIEENLVLMWSEVLGGGKDTIGVKDNFFELGGHSISAIKVTLKIRELYDVDLDITEFMNNPDIESIGEEIQNLLWLKS